MLLVLFKKFIGKRSETALTEQETLEQLVMLVQDGDIKLRNQILADYQPFVAKVTGSFCKRYIDPRYDDEYSVALSAFNEAINRFSMESGRSFLSFSETVIRRRLIDYIRKEQKHKQLIPSSTFELEDEEDNVYNPVEIHESIAQYEEQKTIEDRQTEIAELNQRLQEFGITFMELVDVSPKHTDSRDALIQIAGQLAEHTMMMDKLLKTKTLPMKELVEMVDVSRKTLERNRKYIIAIAVIIIGNYPYLHDYLHIPALQERSEENE
jgi:RNA polymerase sigma factor